jgi:predicted DNA-binding ribbon-helix-helix protein
MSSLINRNVIVAGRSTSIRLEAAMWDALSEIAGREERTVNAICTRVDKRRKESTLTSGLRVYILNHFRRTAKRGR